MDLGEVLDCIKVTSTWFDDVKQLSPAKLIVGKRTAVSKKQLPLSERGLETFRRISKKKYAGLTYCWLAGRSSLGHFFSPLQFLHIMRI